MANATTLECKRDQDCHYARRYFVFSLVNIFVERRMERNGILCMGGN